MRAWLPRERKLALSAVIVVATWVIVASLGQPLWQRWHDLGQQTTVSQEKFDRLRRLASRKVAIERAYREAAHFLSTEPEDLVQRAFLDELEALARAGNLQISLKPRPIQRDGRVSRLGVELEVDATQEALLAFLDGLLSRPSLIELERLRIAATSSQDSPLRATLLVNKVVIRP